MNQPGDQANQQENHQANHQAQAQPQPAPPKDEALLVKAFNRLFLDHWRAIDEEGAAERAALRASGKRYDLAPLWVLVLASLILVFQEYWGDRNTFSRLFTKYSAWHWFGLAEFAWWSGTKLFGYLLVPAVALKLAGYKLGDVGFGIAGFRKHLWVYVALFLAILPVIVIASYTAPFQHTYPFYKMAVRSWSDLLIWEFMYALSFLALEFFFRGYMLFALRRSFGANAIFVMIIPYCMVHFGKPVSEVTGAIFAGIILGTLALRTRSIWCGVLIHISVAWTMDMLALAHTTGLPQPGRFIGG